jgi:hypothetical protein
MFVVVGEGGTILTSTDGEEWLAADSGTTRPLYSVAASSGSFVAVGGGLGIGFQVILRSEDGRTWSPQTVPDIPDMFAPLQGVAHGGQEWRAVGRSGGALVSTDGMHWEKVITGTKGELTGIGYGHGRFVAVGGVLSDAGLLLTSVEGGPWLVVIDAPRTYRSAAYGNGVFVIAGSEGLLRSTDGTNWVREVYPVLPGNLMQPLNDVVFANGLFVAVGDLGTIVHSTDGSRWERTDFGVENINGLVYGDGKFVAVTSLGITGALSCVSTNGIDWTAYGTGEIGVLRAIAFGNGRFVATGEGGLFMHSTNGQEWTLVEDDDIGGWITFPGVAYGNGRFVAVGYGEGSIVVSENGIEWEEIAAVDVADVGFAEGWFVAVAGEGEVIASRTGEFWYACRTNAGLQHVSYVPGKFLTMGVNLIMSSGWMGPSRLSAVGGEGMELMLAGEIGREYSLETSDRLTNGTWHTFARMIASNEVTKIPDLPSEEAIGFFRAGAMDYAPENITGGQVVATVFDGYGMLSASGVYRFSVTGNTYTITPISGPIAADSGVYGYQKVSGDVGVLTLTNSFGWVLRSEVYFSGRDFGEIETKILSSDAVGAQTGTFVME